jgi:hypothetical protein
LVLGITVPGAPYPEDVERRRRTRYAVLAGLEQAGFGPEDRRHIHYFMWSQSPSTDLFVSDKSPEIPLLACGTPVSAHFACVSTASARLFSLWRGTNLQSAQSLPDAASAEPAIVPYEKLRRVKEPDESSDNDSPDSVLVLWLKEDVLMHKPLTALNSLAGLLNRDQNPAVKFIGPSSSDMLHEMVKEAWAQKRLHLQ